MRVAIVGGGPTGLATAWYMRQTGWDVVVLEAYTELGGCHRSWRTAQGVFSEHAVLVYSTRFTVFAGLLTEMGLDFNAFFGSKYKSQIGDLVWGMLTWGDTVIAARNMALGAVSVADVSRGMSVGARVHLGWLTRVIDGGDAERTPVQQLWDLYNLGDTLCLPTSPLGDSLFPAWLGVLEEAGVVVRTNARVQKITQVGTQWSVTSSHGELRADAVVLAMPVKDANALLPTPSSELARYAYRTRYNRYTSAVFVWSRRLVLPPVTVCLTPHALVFTILPFEDGGTTISVTASVGQPDLAALFAELQQQLVGLPLYDGASYHVSNDDAWYHAVDTTYLSPDTPWSGLYLVGPHNGGGSFPATTIENAVTAARDFVRNRFLDA